MPKSDYEGMFLNSICHFLCSDELCSRILEIPLKEELKDEAEQEPLISVNSLLENLQSFTVSSDVKPSP